MKILALELSSAQGSIAWMDDGKVLFDREFANDRKHSGLFFENLECSVAQFGKADRIVVGLGPGSYAGTRIAIATAIGLRALTGGELIGLPSLCAMPTEGAEYAVIGDARRQSFFFACVSSRRCVEGPALFSHEELFQRLEQIAVPAYSSEPLGTFHNVIVNYPSARILARIAETEPAHTSSAPLEPIYLREPHITRPKSISS